jgi:hypothetical protein
MGRELKLDKKIEDFETTNRIINALIDRIEILNRLIDSNDMVALEGSKDVGGNLVQQTETNDDQEMIHKLQRLEKQIEQKNQEIKDKEKDHLKGKTQLEKKLEQKNEEVQNLLKIKKCVEEPYNIFMMYLGFDEEVKGFFSGLIHDEDISKFISSIATKDNLDKLYDKINSYVMNIGEKIEQNGEFDDNQRQLSRLFDFYYEIVSYNESIYDFKRLEEETGNEYDDENCIRIGSASGEIKDILLQGYCIDGYVCKRTIVFVN